MITLSTYLLLDGTCAAAMTFYQQCLGGELTLSRVSDTPMRAHFPPAMHDRVIHARLQGEKISLSASDWMRPQETPVQGNTVCLYIDGGDIAETRAVFARLSVGAVVTDPLREEPFGLYGALNDQFGIRWMFHAAKSSVA